MISSCNLQAAELISGSLSERPFLSSNGGKVLRRDDRSSHEGGITSRVHVFRKHGGNIPLAKCEAASQTKAAEGTNTSQWFQKTIQLPAFSRGCHIITSHISRAVPEISQYQVGIVNIFVMHTSASLTINENASSDVPLDMEDAFNRLVPEGNQYRHLDEGYDDMPAHVKSSMMGCSLTIPISNGRLHLGTWQGIWLNEHRNYGGPRRLCITIQGQPRTDGRQYGPSSV